MLYLKIIFAFIFGIIIALLFPFYLNAVMLLVVIKMIKKNFNNRKPFLMAIVLGMVGKFLIAVIFLFYIYLYPINFIYYNNHETVRTMLVGGEIGIYEKLVSYYCRPINRKNDPFTGKKYLEINGVSYSVGPDGIDNGLKLIYDPTNGTISPGDIIVPK